MLATVHTVLHEELKTSHTALITSLYRQFGRHSVGYQIKEVLGPNLQLKGADYFNKYDIYFIHLNVSQPIQTVHWPHCIFH